MSVVCEPSLNLNELIKKGELNIALVTQYDQIYPSEILRNEPILWASSIKHNIHEADILPLAVGRPTCVCRRSAINALVEAQRDYRILFTSSSASVLSAAVLAGSL